MNIRRLFLAGMFSGLMGFTISSHADDIDIYSSIATNTSLPNVLIILDNSANFSASSGGVTCTLNDGSAPSLGATSGGIEQCAIYNVIDSLGTNKDGSAKINVGIMVYNSTNLSSAYGCNSSGNGGCLMYPLTAMDATGKANLLALVKDWGSATHPIKENNEQDAMTMEEAWAYYAGKTGPSGTNYGTSHAASGCQKNFAIFIANAFGASGTPGDGSGATPGADLSSVITTRIDPTTSAVALTTDQQATFSPDIQIPSSTYGSATYSCGSYTMGTHSETSGLYLDEWARYMYGTDIETGAAPPSKNITTYGVGVIGDQCKPDWPALLSSAARNGGGKYFATSSYSDVVQALLQILNEVQAVNSVFSSASLPVSVNTQGTYLNQIYMGMFRPDQSGFPRWVGNLKQYQFQLDQTNQTLYLADATGTQAISSSGTGFIGSNAASFWTCTNTYPGTLDPYVVTGNTLYNSALAALPPCPKAEPYTGFWRSYNAYVTNSAGGGWDLVDGEIVEKGGAAQILRLMNLRDDYSTTAGSSTNPRHLYTYCPQDTSNSTGTCVADLTNAANVMSPSNSNITSAMFGSGGTFLISQISRSGLVATASTNTATGLKTGELVTISGASPSDYNGTVTVTSTPDSRTFTYDLKAEYPAGTLSGSNYISTGTYSATLHSASGSSITSLTRGIAGTGSTGSFDTASVTAVTSSPYAAGSSVSISGASPAEYNGNVTSTGSTATSFTYDIAVNPPATAKGSYTVKMNNASGINVSTAVCSASKTLTITTATAHNMHTGDLITLSGSTANNGTYDNANYTVTVTSTTQIAIQKNLTAPCTGNTAGNGGTVVAGPSSPISLTSLTRNETTPGTATATAVMGTGNNFASGDIVDIVGTGTNQSSEANYTNQGPYTISCSGTCSTFSYTISTTPVGTASGTITASSTGTIQTISKILRPAPVGSTPGKTYGWAVLQSGQTGFANGDRLDISSSSTGSDGPGYAGTYYIQCQCDGATCNPAVATGYCSQFTYGPLNGDPGLPLTPVSPASQATTGVSIAGYSSALTIDKTALINWIRGDDNEGDEQSLCPGGVTASDPNAIAGADYSNCTVVPTTVRPSVHGDTLHSRPIAVNYGGSIGVIVYYGTNDGIYHAINGNQPCSTTQLASNPTCNYISGTPPGGELWGFAAADFFAKYNRLRTNLPMLKMPSTPSGIIPPPQKKDYFIDGPTGLYQYINNNGTTGATMIYIAMRRGGRGIYSLNVTTPNTPKLQWRTSNASTYFGEMGQTWSLPKAAYIEGYCGSGVTCNSSSGIMTGSPPLQPVLIFGGGYDDGSEDSEPPQTDTMGRSIYIVNAWYGQLVWAATPNPPASACQTHFCEQQVADMNYSMPSDITLLDPDGDGIIERLYAVDTGGNVWRVDLEPSNKTNANGETCTVSTPWACTPDTWNIHKLAALGCTPGSTGASTTDLGTCNSGTTPRKFFFPPEVISNYSSKNYDAVFVGSGDREHPLITNQSYDVVNRMYMLKDTGTIHDADTSTTITESDLYDCTTACTATTPYADQNSGYYYTLGTGEKVVNAPLATAGFVYFGTNQPTTASNTACTTNLGIARGYRFYPFKGAFQSVTFDGGGLPPSPVSGVVNIDVNGVTEQLPFLIGGGNPDCKTGTDCNSALGGQKPTIDVPTTRTRTYWYIEGK